MKKYACLMLVFCMIFLCSCSLFTVKMPQNNEDVFEDFKNVNNDFEEKKPTEIINIDNQYGIELLLEILSSSKVTLTYKQNEIPEDTEIMCGDDFYVERQNKLGEWIALEINENMAWHSIGYTLSEGSTKSWTIDLDKWYKDFDTGHFRICKPFSIKEKGEYYKNYVVKCDFSIIRENTKVNE